MASERGFTLVGQLLFLSELFSALRHDFAKGQCPLILHLDLEHGDNLSPPVGVSFDITKQSVDRISLVSLQDLVDYEDERVPCEAGDVSVGVEGASFVPVAKPKEALSFPLSATPLPIFTRKTMA